MDAASACTARRGTDAHALGAPILCAVSADDAVDEIHAGTLRIAGTELPFGDAVRQLADAYVHRLRADPVPGACCGDCQFKSATPSAAGELRSGFHECWSQAFGWTDGDFSGGTVLDIWNFRKKDELVRSGVLKLTQITLDDLKHDGQEAGTDGMSARHRQWYQCHGGWPGGGDFYFDAPGMRAAMGSWRYPLHFIDFETCSVALPFAKGRRPYETIAFQFSHHVMREDGGVEHRTQFLEATPGVDPSLSFVRALRDALSGDTGTVFRWASHENTVLSQLRKRLLSDPQPPADAQELVAFIESITQANDAGSVAGHRSMVDLCKLAERHFFHPQTKGSSSLKRVLPALMCSSLALRRIYGQPVYATASMPSLNLREPMQWWVEAPGGGVLDPYHLLPPVFQDIDPAVSSLPEALQDGGAAMTAYARLQFEDLSTERRAQIESALLRYCELDTLAMAMAVQAWQEWAQ